MKKIVSMLLVLSFLMLSALSFGISVSAEADASPDSGEAVSVMDKIVDFIQNLADSLMDIVFDVYGIVFALIAIFMALGVLFWWIFG